MNPTTHKENDLQHVFMRRGPFLKDWTEEKTVVFLFRVPIAAKIKLPALKEIRLLGIPVLQKQVDEFTITLRVLGVCVKRRANTLEMAKRINARIEETKQRLQPDEIPDSEAVMQRQLDMLDRLKAMRRDRS